MNIKQLLGICEHTFVPIHSYDITDTVEKTRIVVVHINRCTKCGKLKQFRVKV